MMSPLAIRIARNGDLDLLPCARVDILFVMNDFVLRIENRDVELVTAGSGRRIAVMRYH